MRKTIILSSSLLILLSGCSSKLDSLNLKEHENENKHAFLKTMDLKSAEVIFEIKDKQVNVLDIGKNFTLKDLNNYKQNNKNTSCLFLSMQGNKPCSISKDDDIFYEKNFSFANSLTTTVIEAPLALVEDTLGLLFFRKPTSTVNTLKNGYTNRSKDDKNINILAIIIEKKILKEKLFQELRTDEIFSYFNNQTITYQSGDVEYHAPNYITYYKERGKEERKGIWNVENNQACYKYDDDPKKYCHNIYLYKNKYMGSTLEKLIKQEADTKNLKEKYEKIVLKKEKIQQEKVEKKRLEKQEKLHKIANAEKMIGQTVVWYDSHRIYDEKGVFFNLIRLWTTYEYRYTGVLQKVNNSTVSIKVTDIKLSVPSLVSVDYIRYKHKAIKWGNKQIGVMKKLSIDADIRVLK